MCKKSGIKSVFAKTLSENGKRIFEFYRIDCEYEVLTEKIINRSGTDICTTGKAVMGADDPEEAYAILKNELKQLQAR